MRISNRFNKLLLAAMMVSVGFISCTRAAKETRSTISFSLPQNAQSFDTLIHVSVNITGSGIPAPIVFNWDLDSKGSATAATSPSSFALDIPQGPDRLIQVLAVYGDSSSSNSGGGAMKFYYGDIIKTLAAASEDVPVVVTSVGAGATIISGRIQGRYLSSASNSTNVSNATDGPTSRIDIVYVPPGGKTPMIVERAMMISGWFQFFGLIGAKLGYRMEDGKFLWDGPVDLSETSFPASSQVLRAAVPIHLKKENYSGTTTTRQEDPSVYIYGFFGDATSVSSKAVCKTAGTTLTRLLKVGTSTPLTVTDNNSAEPSNLLDTTLGFINLRGGVSLGSTGPCVTQTSITTNLFETALGFKANMLENGDDNSADFKLPFQLPTSSSNSGNSALASTIIDADNISVSGTLLPGVASVLDNFVVYKAINLGTNFHYNSSFASCEALPGMGFSLVGNTAVSGSTYQATLPLTDAEATGGAVFALCPTKAGVSMGLGVWLYASYMRYTGGCSGCGGPSIATKLSVVTPQAYGGSTIANSTCTPAYVEGRDASNNLAQVPAGTTFTLISSNGEATLYTNSYCSTPVSASTSMNSMQYPFYIRRTVAGSASSVITVSGNSSLIGNSTTVNFIDPLTLTSATKKIKIIAPPSINAYMCIPITFESWYDDGTTAYMADFGYTSYTLPTIAGTSYYYSYDWACSYSTTTNLSLGSTNGVSNQAFVKYTGAGTSLNLQPTSASPVYDGTYVGGNNITAVPAGTAVAVRLSMSNSFGAESCQSVNLQVVDSMNNPSPTPQAITLNFTFNGSATPPANAGFYADPSCSTGINPAIAVSDTQASNLYFRWPTSGVLAIDATIATGPAGISFQPYTTTVGPTVVGSIVAYPSNGVTFAWPNTFAGLAMPIQKGQPFNITLEARSPLGNLVMGFNDTNAGPNGVNLQDSYSSLNCGAISWSVGMGNVTCSVPNSPDYFASIMDGLKTGGGATIYPSFYGTPNVRVTRAAEEANTSTYLISKPFSYYANTCQPLMVTRGNYLGIHFISSRVTSGMSYNANLTYSNGVAGFYSDSSCGTSITQTSLGAGQSTAIVYVKMDGTTPANYLAMQADSNGVTDLGNTGLSFGVNAAPSTFTQYNISMSAYQFYHSCSPVMVVRADANGAAVAAGGSENATFASNFAGSWYSDASCTTGLSGDSTTFNSGDAARLVYFRPDITTLSSGNITVSNGSQTGAISGINVQP
ncbi:MAG TPA: hypothetical protein VIG33_08205 [Pseudobdellovibrionaceae bacterium]|jgi:hypothetical protein